MKRIGNIYPQIYSRENLALADKRARQGKSHQAGVIKFDTDREAKIIQLSDMLKNKRYKTSAYKTFTVHEPKERLVSQLPYWPDRVAQWGIMLQLEKMFTSCFTANTYSCIKGRGINGATTALRKALKDAESTTYCLQLDIRKFYASINHEALKKLLRRKIKDNDLLWLLDEIIDSAPGLPIGNLLSQYFANYYLTPFDHWLKEKKRVKKCFRYADDIIILAATKEELHQLLYDIRQYFEINLKIEIKNNYQIYPVASRGINFVGFIHFHNYVLLRKSIKQACARMIANNYNLASVGAYKGWLLAANCINLSRKLKIAA